MPYINETAKARLKVEPTPRTVEEIEYFIHLEFKKAFKGWNKPKILLLGKKKKGIGFPGNEIGEICLRYVRFIEKEAPEILIMSYEICTGVIINSAFEFIRRNPYKMHLGMLEQIGKVAFDYAAHWFNNNVVWIMDKNLKRNGDIYEKAKNKE